MKSASHASVLRLSFWLALAVTHFGCGSSNAPLPAIAVTVSPATATVEASGTQQFTPTVANDPADKGVNWTVSCSAAPCGQVSPTATLSGVATTYTAPPTAPVVSLAVTLTATSVSNPSISAKATVNIPPAGVSISVVPTISLTHVNGLTGLESTEQNDSNGTGVTWSLQGCNGGAAVCGSLGGGNCLFPSECFIRYSAPAAVPPGGQVTVVATSILDPTKSASGTVGVSPIYFVSPASYPAGTAPEGVTVADFNGDGKLDLAVADVGNPATGDNGGVWILLGNGDGTFMPAQLVAAGKNPTFVTVGDFNGDGKMDLAVSDLGDNPSGGDGNVAVVLGNGDGTFQSPIQATAGVAPFRMALGDFNGDGKLDIAVIDVGDLSGDYGAIDLLLGNGDGTFQAPIAFNAGGTPGAVGVDIVARDFNGDSKLDLAVASADLGNPLAAAPTAGVLLGNGDGSFQAPALYNVAFGADSLTSADFKGNGKADLALTGWVCSPTGNQCGSWIQVLFGNGDGTFQSPQYASLTDPGYLVSDTDCEGIGICYPSFLAVADFDGSGNAGLVGINEGGVFVLPGNGDGSFEGVLGYFGTAPGVSVLAIGDFNGDGKPDIAVANKGGPNVTVLLNETVPYGAQSRTKRKTHVTSCK